MQIHAFETTSSSGVESQPLKSTGNALNVGLTGPASAVTVAAYGYLCVSDEPRTVFNDPLDTLDTTTRWTLKTSTGTASVTAGTLTCASSTTANAYGGVATQANFQHKGLNFLLAGAALKFANSTIANTARWFGWGSVTTPTTTVPVQNGAGFLLDGTGALYAKIYSGGAEIFSANISAYKQADGTFARAAVVMRSDLVIFYYGSIQIPVASANFQTPAVQTLPLSALSIAGAVAPASSATIDISAIGAGDSGKNGTGITDADYAWRSVRVSAANQLVTKEFAEADSDWQYATPVASPITVSTAVAMKAAAGTGIRNYVTGFTAYNNSATASVISIQDGTTVIYTDYLPANGAIRVTFPTPLRGTANTAMNVVLATAATSTFVSAQGFIGA